MPTSSKTFKWIVFRIINYIHIVVGLFILAAVLYGSVPTGFSSVVDFLGFLLAVVATSVFVGNGLSNLFLLEKFFPDQLPPKAASRFNLVTYILLIIESLLLIILAIVMITDEFEGSTGERVSTAVVGGLGVTSLPLWVLQANLRDTLKRNFYRNLDQFLENENP